MAVLVVGSVAYDSIETPFGNVKNALGGSATYFSVSASYFTPVNLVAVVGDDFEKKNIHFLEKRGINTEGLEKKPGKTFRWSGRYNYDFSNAQTIATHLNVFQRFEPKIPKKYIKNRFVFLANIDPQLQLSVLSQVEKPQLVACDTMNFWITSKKKYLLKVLKKVDIFLLNEGEARQLSGESNLIKAGRKILSLGPKKLVVKKGEHGSLLFDGNRIFSAPAYMLETIYDPTGAGDTFAGGFIGYLAKEGKLSDRVLRKALIYGTIMASFTVEDFSLRRLGKVTEKEIQKRYRDYELLTRY